MREATQFRPVKLDFWFERGGLGDSIARLPALNYVLTQHPHVEHARVFLQDYFVPLAEVLMKHHGNRISFYGYSEAEQLLKIDEELGQQRPAMQTDSVHHTTLRTHITEHAFHTLADAVPIDPKWYRYPRINEPFIRPTESNYVVITTGFTAPVREMLPGVINEVATWVRAQNLQVVFLGKQQNSFSKTGVTTANFREDLIDYTLGINLIDKTSLIEAAGIMGAATAVVGLDNGLLHLAGCTDAPIVAAYTTVHPEHRVPRRESGNVYVVTPPETLGCRFCQTQMGFVYKYDFRSCLYNDYECVKQIQAKQYVEALKEIIYA